MTPLAPPAHFIQGDAARLPLADASVALVMTSPPYADQRKHTYGGVHPDRYVEWFLPIGAEMMRVLKPDGSFVLNIKEKAVDGERHPYVLNLINALRGQGWRWVEEYIWHKTSCYPGKWPNRFRDAWERCLHFTRGKVFYMDQKSVRVPAGDWQRLRLPNESRNDGNRYMSTSGSRFSRKVCNWQGRDLAYPSNVLRIAAETRTQGHSAAFPVALPTFFVKLFTRPGDVVLDPFAGSGTTAVACRDLGRRCVAIDLHEPYLRLGMARVTKPAARTAKVRKVKPVKKTAGLFELEVA